LFLKEAYKLIHEENIIRISNMKLSLVY